MGGLEVLQTLHGQGTDVPVLVLTADIQETTRQQCLELGAAGFINKPLHENDAKWGESVSGSGRRRVQATIRPGQPACRPGRSVIVRRTIKRTNFRPARNLYLRYLRAANSGVQSTRSSKLVSSSLTILSILSAFSSNSSARSSSFRDSQSISRSRSSES